MAGPGWPTAALLDAAAGLAIQRLPGVAPVPSLGAEIGVITMALLVIGSIPGFPVLLCYLFWRAWRAEPEQRRKAWAIFAAVLAGYAFLALVPVAPRPQFMQSRIWRWWLEYMSVRLAYPNGEPLPARQYMIVMMPHGLYPFSGACATISKMVEVFFRMRFAVAPVGLRIPGIRQLMGWIGVITADRASISKALAAGETVGIFPGGIGEMMRTDHGRERILLLERKGFVRSALEHGVPIVPVYVFGQSMPFGHLQLPDWVERLSRWLRASIILPYGRFGLLIPRKLPLLFAIGAPIECPRVVGDPDEAQVDSIHSAVVAAVRELYDRYKGMYGWGDRPLSIE